MSFEQNLPFPRGGTACDGAFTPAATTYENLEGRIFEVKDTVHGLGGNVHLAVVRNDSGSAITVARKTVRFGTAAGDIGRKVAGLSGATGQIGKPIDDAYTVGASIPANDLFYVVYAGPCDILSCTSATAAAALTVGSLLTTDNGGQVGAAAATTGNFILGVADETPADSSTAYRVMVNAGYGATY